MWTYSILQRAGVVPMSIAGIAKEVTTITLAAALFDDDLTPLNITGVAITACGASFRSARTCEDTEPSLGRHCTVHLPQVPQVD